MKIYRYFMIPAIVGALSIFACTEQKKESFNSSHDILQKIGAQIQQQTQTIDFRKESNPGKKYLLRGWGLPGKEGTWALKESSLLFYSYDTKNNLDIEILCRTIPSKENEKQITYVLLNEKDIGSFVVESTNDHNINFTLPASSLKSGVNILQFNFSYTTKPGFTDQNLSVAFQKITFKNNNKLQYFGNTGLVQHANSAFNVLSKLPDRFELDIQYQNLRGATSSIELINEKKEKVTIKPPSKDKTYKKTIHLKDKGIYKIRFVTKGSSESYTVWSKIQVNMHKKEDVTQWIGQGFSKRTKPDILLYVVDTLRADHLGCYGYQRNTSPNIDKFAEENSFFRNAYANASWTRASGASILTGLFPKHHKTMTRADKLPNSVVTLAEILHENGYYTIAFSTNDNIGPDFGFDQGFDEFFGLFQKDPPTWVLGADKINEEIFKSFRIFIDKKEPPPLFMLVWTMEPHQPYSPPVSVKEMFNIDQYTPINTYDPKLLEKILFGKIQQPTVSQIEYMKTHYDQEIFFNDRAFGELLDAMRSLGIYDDAIIIFTSDHGEEFFEHGSVEHGWTLYNEVIKIPLIIKTKHIEQGEYKERVQLMDIYPTILDVLGIGEPYRLDGISLLHNTKSERTLYFEQETYGCDLKAEIDNERKLIFTRFYNRAPAAPSEEIIPIFELYDTEDIFEQHNLAFSGLKDDSRLQKLFLYMNSESGLGLQQTHADISPELDQHLKDLGYVK